MRQGGGIVLHRWKYPFLAIVALVIVASDQWVKHAVVAHFDARAAAMHVEPEQAAQPVIPGLFNLIITRNPGAAWGMLGDLEPDGLRVAVFVLISCGAIAMVLWLARRAKPGQDLLVIALSLVLGGALGNLVDRIAAGRVVDFLDFYTRAPWFLHLAKLAHRECDPFEGCHWPAFNVADMCISTGVTLLVFETFLTGRRERRAKAIAAASPPAPVADVPAPIGGNAAEPPRVDSPAGAAPPEPEPTDG